MAQTKWLMNRGILLIIIAFLFNSFLYAQNNVPAIYGNNQEQSKTIEELRIFPNPAIDYVQISNNALVKKIVILNIFSKEVKSFQHYNNAQHDISDLKPGLYIIKMIDEKNKVLKSLRFNKNFDGA